MGKLIDVILALILMICYVEHKLEQYKCNVVSICYEAMSKQWL